MLRGHTSPTPDNDFIPLAEAARLTGRSYSRMRDLAAGGLLGGRRLGAAQRWHVRRSLLANMPPRDRPLASRSERPWLRLVADNDGRWPQSRRGLRHHQ